MLRSSRPAAALVAAALFVGACGSTAPTGAESAPAPSAPAIATAGDASLAELEALYAARKDSAMMRYTPADVAFMIGMIGHHAQALVMTALAPPNDASPAVQTLAARITNAQRDEIETMQRWLRERGEAVPEVHIEGTNLMIHGAGGHHHMNMPGMLSAAQLEELAAARGPVFDRLFLEYMIQHHGGAVVMVEELFGQDGAAQDEAVFKFASDVQVDQRTEIARMQRMLNALPAAD